MSNEAEKLFEKAEALLKGHFLLASGLHSPVYWEKFQVLQYPEYTEQLCRMIAEHYRNQDIQLVIGPTTGGIILSFEVARQLGLRGIFAEREGEDKRVFKRGFKINPGERVLIVDDVLTTGSSVKQVIEAVEKAKGTIIGIGILVDRSVGGVNFGYPLFSCLQSDTATYKPEDCPLCAEGIPLTKRGSS